jgi:hypothetical protein
VKVLQLTRQGSFQVRRDDRKAVDEERGNDYASDAAGSAGN